MARASAEWVPKTSRSGRSVSSTAYASRRNSGFQATSTASPAGAWARSRSSSAIAVPTGTVDLPTTRVGSVSSGASVSTAACSWDRSAAPPGPDGVPRARKCTSAQSAISA